MSIADVRRNAELRRAGKVKPASDENKEDEKKNPSNEPSKNESENDEKNK